MAGNLAFVIEMAGELASEIHDAIELESAHHPQTLRISYKVA
jgi:hypothetical protein